jgi:hypothetical protein
MEFNIKKNGTLPLLKMQVVDDGRGEEFDSFMSFIETSSLYFSMMDVETGSYKIHLEPAGFVEKTQIDPNAKVEYYIYYKFPKKYTNRVGRYEGEFVLKNSDGTLILPIREKLYINILESTISDEIDEILSLTLGASVNSGSTIITYSLTSSQPVFYNTTVNFSHVLETITGNTVVVTTGLTISSLQKTSTLVINLSGVNYNNLTQISSFSGITVLPIGLVDSVNVTENVNFVDPEPTPTPTRTPTNTVTPTPTQTPTNTVTPTITESETPTPTPTTELIESPTLTPTNTVTPTITESETPTQTPTNTITPTITESETPTPTPTSTIALVASSTPTTTPTITETPSNTPTRTQTPTNSITPTNTRTQTVTPTITRTNTPSPVTPTPTRTTTVTPTPTQTSLDLLNDSIYQALSTTGKTAYLNASVGDFFFVSESDWNNVITGVTGSTTYGAVSDAQFSQTASSEFSGGFYIADSGQSGLTAGNYVLGFRTRASRTSGGQNSYQFRIISGGTINGTYVQIGNLTSSVINTVANATLHYIRKHPQEATVGTSYFGFYFSSNVTVISATLRTCYYGFSSTAPWGFSNTFNPIPFQLMVSNINSWGN